MQEGNELGAIGYLIKSHAVYLHSGIIHRYEKSKTRIKFYSPQDVGLNAEWIKLDSSESNTGDILRSRLSALPKGNFKSLGIVRLFIYLFIYTYIFLLRDNPFRTYDSFAFHCENTGDKMLNLLHEHFFFFQAQNGMLCNSPLPGSPPACQARTDVWSIL